MKLSDEHIRLLFPKFGPQVKFQNLWKNLVSSSKKVKYIIQLLQQMSDISSINFKLFILAFDLSCIFKFYFPFQIEKAEEIHEESKIIDAIVTENGTLTVENISIEDSIEDIVSEIKVGESSTDVSMKKSQQVKRYITEDSFQNRKHYASIPNVSFY